MLWNLRDLQSLKHIWRELFRSLAKIQTLPTVFLEIVIVIHVRRLSWLQNSKRNSRAVAWHTTLLKNAIRLLEEENSLDKRYCALPCLTVSIVPMATTEIWHISCPAREVNFSSDRSITDFQMNSWILTASEIRSRENGTWFVYFASVLLEWALKIEFNAKCGCWKELKR